MILDEAHKQKVIRWIDEGLKLYDIQKLMDKELGLQVTYMDLRLLLDDLKLAPKDPVIPPAPAKPEEKAKPAPPAELPPALPGQTAAPAGPSEVSVSIDELTHPGAVVSGKVTFSDGQTASWYLDQMGRLGMAPAQKGYRPPAEDVQKFQLALENALSKGGL